ncbi:unnamed protein product [Blepharisma stoltei]|uniref:Uncharacterized protein n=1 Tax=Blepharisma stoltei TaxID=1481888 RepID=A0AAU9IFT5_9CILI|nr:unnamed protein product [Blepharisma stoltei]
MNEINRQRSHLDMSHISVEPMPPFPSCTLLIYITGVVFGGFLILIGFIEEVTNINPMLGSTFWVLGALIFIPSIYFTILLIKLLKIEIPADFVRIAKDIPQL